MTRSIATATGACSSIVNGRNCDHRRAGADADHRCSSSAICTTAVIECGCHHCCCRRGCTLVSCWRHTSSRCCYLLLPRFGCLARLLLACSSTRSGSSTGNSSITAVTTCMRRRAAATAAPPRRNTVLISLPQVVAALPPQRIVFQQALQPSNCMVSQPLILELRMDD